MSQVIIFHGTDCHPESKFYWYQWLKSELESNGCEVKAPYYSEINHESIDKFLPKIIKEHSFNEETILVGHSSGASLILSILDEINVKVRFAVLVSGYVDSLNGKSLDPVQKNDYNWEKMRNSSADFLIINSANDPWGCDDKQGRILFDHLGGTQVIKNDGHFGSESKNLPYNKFPMIRDAILELNS